MTLYCKILMYLQTASYVLNKSKNVILHEVFKTIWTRVRTSQKSAAARKMELILINRNTENTKFK